MKRFLVSVTIGISSFLWSQVAPNTLKTEFTNDALSQKVVGADGKKVSIKNILEKYKGEVLVIDFWASWCKDCILALPKTKELIVNNPSVKFIYLSLDRSMTQWKNGLEKYQIKDKENYWFDEGWKNKFNNYIDLNWVPRFIVISQEGGIAKYYAISPDDPELQLTIDRLTKKQ